MENRTPLEIRTDLYVICNLNSGQNVWYSDAWQQSSIQIMAWKPYHLTIWLVWTICISKLSVIRSQCTWFDILWFGQKKSNCYQTSFIKKYNWRISARIWQMWRGIGPAHCSGQVANAAQNAGAAHADAHRLRADKFHSNLVHLATTQRPIRKSEKSDNKSLIRWQLKKNNNIVKKPGKKGTFLSAVR